MLKKFIVERASQGLGELSELEMSDMAQKALHALDRVGPGIQWNESYVTQDKLYSVYLAESEELIMKYSRISGLPITKISEVQYMLDPTNADYQTYSENGPRSEDIFDSIL